MRFSKWFIILVVYLLLLLNVVNAKDMYVVNYKCPDACVQGREIRWNLNITNYGHEDLFFIQARLIDASSKVTLVETERSEETVSLPETIGSESPSAIRIPRKETVTFDLNSTLPEPNNGTDLNYRLCLTRRAEADAWSVADVSNEYCFVDNHTVNMLECTADHDCGANEWCENNTCYELNCSECQYIEFHRCNDWECCDNVVCDLDQHCVNHTCIDLNCSEFNMSVLIAASIDINDVNATNATLDSNTISNNMTNESSLNITDLGKTDRIYIVNHTCTLVPCSDGEIYQDFKCIKTDCEFDEYLEDYECKKLNCNYYEEIINQTCVMLNCSIGEYPMNHSCYSINYCSYDEIIQNNSCVKVECKFLQTPENHECLFNSMKLIQILLFLFVLLLILLDYKKLKHMYRKRLVRKLMRKAKERSRK